MAKSKSAKSSTETKEPTKLIDRYPDLFFLREQPMPEVIIKRLVAEMIEFSDRPTTLRASQFWNDKKINSGYYWQWKEKFPELKQAYEYMLARIAERRDLGAMTREFDGNYIKDSQPMYDPEYKALLEWKAHLAKKEEGAGQGNITVVLEQFPESRLVPKKKVDE